VVKRFKSGEGRKQVKNKKVVKRFKSREGRKQVKK